MNDEIAKELVEIARELTAGSETARDALYSHKSSLKQLGRDVMTIRNELREQGLDKEADLFFLKAHDALGELNKLFTKAERAGGL